MQELVFDKTGTLTSGKPVVSEVVSFDPRIDPLRILEYAAIAEKNVNHPMAKTIVTKARETNGSEEGGREMINLDYEEVVMTATTKIS